MDAEDETAAIHSKLKEIGERLPGSKGPGFFALGIHASACP